MSSCQPERRANDLHLNVLRGRTPAVEGLQDVRAHGVELEPIAEPDRLVEAGFRIARMMNEDYGSMVGHIQGLMGEFSQASSCRIYLNQKADVKGKSYYRLEPRLSIEKTPGNEFYVTSEDWKASDIESAIMQKSFNECRQIVIDYDNSLQVLFENLDMNSHACDVYPLEAAWMEDKSKHMSVIPLFYRDKESPFGVAIFDGIDCSDKSLGSFGRTFWTAKIAMAAASQISFALIHRFDAVTGLPSKNDFNVDLHAFIRRLLHAEVSDLKLMLIDLDGFKTINDSFSYRTGNRILRETAKRIESAVRADDSVSRWGGDEFSIILPGISMGDSCSIARRINAEVAGIELQTEKGAARISCSVGIVDVGSVLERLLKTRRAAKYYGEEMRLVQRAAKRAFDVVDGLLKAAKKSGKNSVFFDDDGMARECANNDAGPGISM